MNNDIEEKGLTALYWLAASLIVIILLAIIGYIFFRGIGVMNLDFITSKPGAGGKIGGILTPMLGTMYTTLGALLTAVPIGIGTAIYLEEYARRQNLFAYLVNLTSETLAGIPSIVYGLFGFVFFVLYLDLGWSIISASLTLAIMILPTITRTTQEAILAVPREYRENSLALGASSCQTISKIVLPSALPGIMTGIILSIGRAVGETAALILTAGSSLGMPESLVDPARTLSVHLYILAMEGISMPRAFGTALAIVIMILMINYLAGWSMRRLSRSGRYK
ncbi:MAG: phosphate ABC transporter permease PstA [Syntrophomonadaceae bacterium]